MDELLRDYLSDGLKNYTDAVRQEERDSLLAELRERIDRADTTLHELLNEYSVDSLERLRIAGKIEGVRLVRDWLRSY